jgi:hypothetical protein
MKTSEDYFFYNYTDIYKIKQENESRRRGGRERKIEG